MPQKSSKGIYFDQHFFQVLGCKQLLLDTSFFGDFSAHPEVFCDFQQRCKDAQVSLVTIAPVIAEFAKGSLSAQSFKDKLKLVNSIIDYLMPLLPNVFAEELSNLVENYKEFGKSVSITDFILGAVTKLHKDDVFLLTKNPADFPFPLYNYKTHFLLKLPRALQVYGVYRYEQ